MHKLLCNLYMFRSKFAYFLFLTFSGGFEKCREPSKKCWEPSKKCREPSKNVGNLRKNVGNLRKMSGTFEKCREPSKNVGNLRKMSGTFEKCREPSKNVGNLRKMSGTFEKCREPSKNWEPSKNVRNLRKMSGTFEKCREPYVVSVGCVCCTRELPPLPIGTFVLIQGKDKKWKKQGKVIEVLDRRQYRVCLFGSGRITLWNQLYLARTVISQH